MTKAIGAALVTCWYVTWLALSLGAAIMAVRWCWAQVVG